VKFITLLILFIYCDFLVANINLDTTLADTTLADTTLADTTLADTTKEEIIIEKNKEIKLKDTLNIFAKRLKALNEQTPMGLDYNIEVQRYIDNYKGRNKSLISKMLSVKNMYFPLFERELDKFKLPLELKYLAIVESALQPKAKSRSGATGLWQFMYLTGKQYGLNVSSYVDDRQDPYKSTIAACNYFVDLYEMFGDWNLVLAAYNGGPGYLQRKINEVGSYNFWDLHPHLKEETRNYVPKFIATNYIMNHYKEHNISPNVIKSTFSETDTLTIKQQTNVSTLSAILCLDQNLIRDLNPSFKEDIIPENANLFLPKTSITDFLLNERASYIFISAVETKEILINEERVIYSVKKGDYLGKIANDFNVRVFELKKWNNLNTSHLDIGDKLVIYVKTPRKI
jgi:membrane-bound lytic murein transglycosylase D